MEEEKDGGRAEEAFLYRSTERRTALSLIGRGVKPNRVICYIEIQVRYPKCLSSQDGLSIDLRIINVHTRHYI